MLRARLLDLTRHDYGALRRLHRHLRITKRRAQSEADDHTGLRTAENSAQDDAKNGRDTDGDRSIDEMSTIDFRPSGDYDAGETVRGSVVECREVRLTDAADQAIHRRSEGACIKGSDPNRFARVGEPHAAHRHGSRIAQHLASTSQQAMESRSLDPASLPLLRRSSQGRFDPLSPPSRWQRRTLNFCRFGIVHRYNLGRHLSESPAAILSLERALRSSSDKFTFG